MLIQTIDDCILFGTGERYFPDQPLLIQVRETGPGRLLLKIEGGTIIGKYWRTVLNCCEPFVMRPSPSLQISIG
jgi:hypothetical protein